MNCIEKYVGGVGCRVCVMTAAVTNSEFAKANEIGGLERCGRAIALPLSVATAPIVAPLTPCCEAHEVLDATVRIGGKAVESEMPWYMKPTTHKVVGCVTLAAVAAGITAGVIAIAKHNSDD